MVREFTLVWYLCIAFLRLPFFVFSALLATHSFVYIQPGLSLPSMSVSRYSTHTRYNSKGWRRSDTDSQVRASKWGRLLTKSLYIVIDPHALCQHASASLRVLLRHERTSSVHASTSPSTSRRRCVRWGAMGCLPRAHRHGSGKPVVLKGKPLGLPFEPMVSLPDVPPPHVDTPRPLRFCPSMSPPYLMASHEISRGDSTRLTRFHRWVWIRVGSPKKEMERPCGSRGVLSDPTSKAFRSWHHLGLDKRQQVESLGLSTSSGHLVCSLFGVACGVSHPVDSHPTNRDRLLVFYFLDAFGTAMEC